MMNSSAAVADIHDFSCSSIAAAEPSKAEVEQRVRRSDYKAELSAFDARYVDSWYDEWPSSGDGMPIYDKVRTSASPGTLHITTTNDYQETKPT